MRRLIRSFGVIVLSVASTILLAGTQTMTPLAALTATALIMGGTGHPLSTPQDSPEFINSYINDANNDYIVLTGYCGADSCTPTAVSTPEQFMPVSGTMPFDQSVGHGVTNLDQAINAQPAGESIVVFGYSQSARIASIQKANLAAAGSTVPLSFVLIGNPNRPNGGILQRFEGLEIPILGVTFDGATPTDTDFDTVDVTRQYDGWSDFPINPLNPFATANAVAGIHYLHGDYQSVGLGNALYQGSYGDTDYYMIPSQRLPLLMPLAEAGVPSPVLAVLDAPARVLVEAGYNRTISPGQPAHASVLYFPNPVTTGVNFIVAIPTGLDDGAQEAANIRPFGTAPIDQRSPYGVGGPPVNAGSFDTTGASLTSTPPPTASVPNTRPPTAKLGPVAAPAAPVAGTPSLTAPAPPLDKSAPAKPATEMTWWRPGQLPRPAPPAEMPKSLPPAAEVPKPAPADIPAGLSKPADVPSGELPRAEIIPKLVPPKIEPVRTPIPVELPKPVDIPAPEFVPPEIPAALPVPPPAQAPSLPKLPALPVAPPSLPELPVLPVAPPPMPELPALPVAPPPMPVLPPPLPLNVPAMPALPPMPALPNLSNVFGGFRLPF